MSFSVTEPMLGNSFYQAILAGTAAMGKPLEAACDRCFVTEGVPCHGERGNKVPPHVSRARAARWAEMLKV